MTTEDPGYPICECATFWPGRGHPEDCPVRREIERLRGVLHEIAEEWAGSECGEPVTAQEGYAIMLLKRIYALAIRGSGDETDTPADSQPDGDAAG